MADLRNAVQPDSGQADPGNLAPSGRVCPHVTSATTKSARLTLGIAAGLVLAAAGTLVSAPADAVTPPTGGAAAVLSGMTLPQRVGQLFMVGTPATAANRATLSRTRTNDGRGPRAVAGARARRQR